MTNKLQHISQLEMLYKACIYTLRTEGIEVPEKHETLLDNTPDHDAVNLLDTLDILHDLIMSHDNYSELKEQNSIAAYAKSKVITVDSLDVLEQQLGFNELELEMGTDIYLDDTLELVVEYALNENSVETLDEFKSYFDGSKHWNLKLYHAEHDRKYVAVFS